ncbi:acyl-CoA dehydrogenase family protein [Caulobacter sp. S45]|jgi:alkylation response protein AidB-like acyl-CoA dehydrogenase|uniref:acyl-CoA dehydrogenase family protein n=1 Tax=Caulobacter sp. S45 TaxID=1641861 RepID=UPI00131B6512|nr:acyl-CoA dehydrogenase family protein [Caulobacter sp. S45]
MDFSFSEEQRLLRDSLASFLADTYSFEARRKAIATEAGWRPEIWRALAQDLGVLGAALPEELGGLGGGPVDNLVVMQALGQALVVEPYLETVVIGAGLLKRIDSPAAKAAVEQIIAGELITTLAWGEPTSRYDPADVSTTARRDGAGWRLDGRKAVVSAAPWASKLLVTARTSGARREGQGISLFLVGKDAPGVTLRDYPTVDGRRAAEITLDGVMLGADALLGQEGQALPGIEATLDEARAALCAEALGVMGEMVRQTVDYAKQRRQFGHAIADFQVLQHRMVDMFIRQEQSVSMTYMATLKLDLPPLERARAVSAAKAHVGRACTAVGQAAVQVHGGIGLTEELALSHYFKRAAMIEQALGSSDFHLRRYEMLDRSGELEAVG